MIAKHRKKLKHKQSWPKVEKETYFSNIILDCTLHLHSYLACGHTWTPRIKKAHITIKGCNNVTTLVKQKCNNSSGNKVIAETGLWKWIRVWKHKANLVSAIQSAQHNHYEQERDVEHADVATYRDLSCTEHDPSEKLPPLTLCLFSNFHF